MGSLRTTTRRWCAGRPQRRSRLAVRHRHVAAERTDDVVALTDGLVALHSTDPVSVYLSAAARMATPSFDPLDEALYEHRSLVRHHSRLASSTLRSSRRWITSWSIRYSTSWRSST